MDADLLGGVHHIAVICSSKDVIDHFYLGVLGLRRVCETYRAERDSWKVDAAMPDGTLLELFTFPAAPARPSRPEAMGLRHLALRTPRLDAAVTALQHAGVATEDVRVDELTGARFTFFADPDGLPIELYEVVG